MQLKAKVYTHSFSYDKTDIIRRKKKSDYFKEKERFVMEMIIVIVALILFIFVSTYFGKRCDRQVGANIAEKHLREQWGMDDKTKYHE